MKKACAKCRKEFECKMGAIDNCHCQHVKISKSSLIQLGKTYSDCLCNKCLKEYITQPETR